MKKFVFIVLMLLSVKATFAQLNADGSPYNMLVFSVGIYQTFMNNPAFDAWTLSNYNKKIGQAINGEGDLTCFLKKYDAGLHFSSSSSFTFIDFYFGKRLTSLNSKISSYLNFDIGGLMVNRYDLAPVNYVPTADQQGKKLKLEYNMTYIGLTSENYFNNLHFHFGKHKKTSFNTGFYVTAGYDPFNDRAWEYGYNDNANATTDDNGDTSVPFNHVDVHDVPLLNRFFMEAGIFVGIGN